MPEGFRVLNLGCKVNRVESDTMRSVLLSSGLKEVAEGQERVCLINSCTVTAEADAKLRKAVRRAAGAESHPQVIVTGCGAALHPHELAALGERVWVIANREAALQAALLSANTPPATAGAAPTVARSAEALAKVLPDSAKALATTVGRTTRVGEGFPTRVGVKVQDGCSNRCSYCIVPQARGAARSRPFAEILDESERLIAAGVRELVISGINVGAYSSDGCNLVALLEKIAALSGRFRLRLSSIEPQDVSDALLDLLARCDRRLCRHLHLPLQSGSDAVLAAMARRYNREQYRELVARARARVPGLALTTDCLVGFPGESEADFAATLALAEQARFSGIHVFRYSRRPNTAAADLPLLPAPTVAKRAEALRNLAERLATADRQQRLGICEEVVMENAEQGRGESYHRVRVNSTQQPGRLLTVRYTGYSKSGMLAEACPRK
ncbi:MAG: tRNA (N(6)-L-threonylcarbamoyladenosine(37)-C(2))-methylthiotransferase MtaB [Coriobacteriales bacterium]|nr:tRNA (N(6)-L-threonylcarbamoyladenosine(37)-C(2))-methylthiotransferase MtaB [Coriobacteriales bacterium]